LAFRLDFGICDVMQLGRDDEQAYLVRFVCGCVGLIASGRMIRRAGGLALVCEHVAVK
jgi:hypothetical protein